MADFVSTFMANLNTRFSLVFHTLYAQITAPLLPATAQSVDLTLHLANWILHKQRLHHPGPGKPVQILG